MAISILPLIPTDPNYAFSTTLENVGFSFVVRWNTRDAAWYLDMYDADGILMIAGEKLVLGSYIGRKSAHPWFSLNVLACIDNTLDELDAGLDDMGTRITLRHYTLTDLVTELISP